MFLSLVLLSWYKEINSKYKQKFKVLKMRRQVFNVVKAVFQSPSRKSYIFHCYNHGKRFLKDPVVKKVGFMLIVPVLYAAPASASSTPQAVIPLIKSSDELFAAGKYKESYQVLVDFKVRR